MATIALPWSLSLYVFLLLLATPWASAAVKNCSHLECFYNSRANVSCMWSHEEALNVTTCHVHAKSNLRHWNKTCELTLVRQASWACNLILGSFPESQSLTSVDLLDINVVCWEEKGWRRVKTCDFHPFDNLRLVAPHSLQVLHIDTQRCNISWKVSQVSDFIEPYLEFEARRRLLGHSWEDASVLSLKQRQQWLFLEMLIPSTSYEVQVRVKAQRNNTGTWSPWSQPLTFRTRPAVQTSAWKAKVIFWYVFLTSVIVFLFSAIGYLVYRYIHVGKEKHPANLVLIYRNEIGTRVFEPTETITLNFITFSMLDDTKISPKDMNLLDKSSDDISVNDPEHNEAWEPHWEEVEGQHLGCSSHLMDAVCGAEQRDGDTSLTQHGWLNSTIPTGETDTEPQYKVLSDFYGEGEIQLSCEPEEAARTEKISEPLVTSANLDPQLEDLHHLGQEHTVSEDGPEEETSITVVDWDPQTGRLCIPSLPIFGRDPENYGHYERDQLLEGGLLSRLYENQAPDKPEKENENCLTRFMEEWGLHVQMES